MILWYSFRPCSILILNYLNLLKAHLGWIWLIVDLLLHGKLYNFTDDVSLNTSLGVRDTLGVLLDDERINKVVFGNWYWCVIFPSEWYLRGGVSMSMVSRMVILIPNGETGLNCFDSVISFFEVGNISEYGVWLSVVISAWLRSKLISDYFFSGSWWMSNWSRSNSYQPLTRFRGSFSVHAHCSVTSTINKLEWEVAFSSSWENICNSEDLFKLESFRKQIWGSIMHF